MHGLSGALGARQRQRTELQLIRPARLPRPCPSIAIDPSSHTTAAAEFDGVFFTVVWRQGLVIAALELDELPGCSRKWRRRAQDCLSGRVLGDQPEDDNRDGACERRGSEADGDWHVRPLEF